MILKTTTRTRILSVMAAMLCYGFVHAQKSTTTNTARDSVATILTKIYTARNKSFLADLKEKTTDKKLWKFYETNFTSISEYLTEEIKEGHVTEHSVFHPFLYKMLREVSTNNPVLRDSVIVMQVKENAANAYTMGDDALFVNIGLLYYLENEDQVISVLSHEMAHLYLDHAVKALRYTYDGNKANVGDVAEVKKAKENKADMALDLLKNSIYKRGIIRREHELQADSLGYAFYKNTGRRPDAFIEALRIIDVEDSLKPVNLKPETYKRFFDVPGQSFKEEWLKGEDFSSYNYNAFTEKFNKDSVSSHPKAEERIKHLQRIYPELAKHQNTVTNPIPSSYAAIKAAAEKERVPNLYANERYGEAVYVSLLFLQDEPENTFYKDWLRKGLRKLYKGRRDYRLNKFLDTVSPKDQSESYMRFLNCMWNLSLTEIKTISDFYSGKTGTDQ